MKTVIKGGNIVNEGRIFEGSIVVEDGNIIEVKGKQDEVCGDDVIDASGCYVLPGVIDDHVHFREPGLTQKADIDSESRAAAAGGVTSYFDMPNCVPQTTTPEALEDKFSRARQHSRVNYSFFYGATNDNADTFSQLDGTRIPGVKLFMGSSTGNMLVDRQQTLERIFKTCRLPLMAHCEDTDIINRNMAAAQEAWGEDPPVSLHAMIRSEEACLTSTQKAVALASSMVLVSMWPISRRLKSWNCLIPAHRLASQPRLLWDISISPSLIMNGWGQKSR
jgi:dihydroorotase